MICVEISVEKQIQFYGKLSFIDKNVRNPNGQRSNSDPGTVPCCTALIHLVPILVRENTINRKEIKTCNSPMFQVSRDLIRNDCCISSTPPV